MRSYLHYINDIHSIFRYVVLLLTAIVVVQNLAALVGKKEFTNSYKRNALFMMIACDVQLMIGLAVYYTNGYILMLKKGEALAGHYNRFYAIEHPVGMILALVLVHLAYRAAKRAPDSKGKIKKLFWYSFIAFVIFVAQTPWPARKEIGKPLFPAMAMENNTDK